MPLRSVLQSEGGVGIKRIFLVVYFAILSLLILLAAIRSSPPLVQGGAPPETTTTHETATQTSTTTTTSPITSIDVGYELCKRMREQYREESIVLLAKVITVEMGADWVSDAAQQMVGSVVLNRVKHDRFPDTLKEVVYQRGQYPAAHNGVLDKCVPTEQALRNAALLWDNGSILPENVVFQAEFKQGTSTYMIYYDPVIKTTTFFCAL